MLPRQAVPCRELLAILLFYLRSFPIFLCCFICFSYYYSRRWRRNPETGANFASAVDMATYDDDENDENKLINEGMKAASLHSDKVFTHSLWHRVQNMEEEQPLPL